MTYFLAPVAHCLGYVHLRRGSIRGLDAGLGDGAGLEAGGNDAGMGGRRVGAGMGRAGIIGARARGRGTARRGSVAEGGDGGGVGHGRDGQDEGNCGLHDGGG
ncbi:hypothetical protein PG993_009180 [Apiospora rasikravindrae]|uniref:Uncharacterized protein n=1 Tax=Apiospora rasikravindrae TaxID=990691 RepID=A0ABR1SIP0_9PEZI